MYMIQSQPVGCAPSSGLSISSGFSCWKLLYYTLGKSHRRWSQETCLTVCPMSWTTFLVGAYYAFFIPLRCTSFLLKLVRDSPCFLPSMRRGESCFVSQWS